MGNHLGLGVMLQRFYNDGQNTVDVVEQSLNQNIKSVTFEEGTHGKNVLRFKLANETTLVIEDHVQSCCEYRHMSTDDELEYYSGATLLEFNLEDGPEGSTGCDAVHDQQFLHVKTSKGSFTVVNHNEHNGYYSGFYIVASLE